jgi:tRNA pseudouridine55 synthase
VPLIHEHPKSYLAEFLLGQSSPTDDIDGEVQTAPAPGPIRRADLERLLPEFLGEIEQIPPAYSAVQVGGRRAYAAARAGEMLDLAPRRVQVSRIELTDFEFPRFSLEIDCGTGTYIRALGRDLARGLGTAAVMSSLVRTRVGPFGVAEACELESLDRAALARQVQSPLVMLRELPQVELSEEDVQRLRWGQSLDWPNELGRDRAVAIVQAAGGKLAAIGREKMGRLAPEIVFPLEQ